MTDIQVDVQLTTPEITVVSAGPAGGKGDKGDSAPAWETVATWADLPLTANWAGRRVKVTAGLGMCVAMWTGSAWVVAPEADTGMINMASSLFPNGESGITINAARIRRLSNSVFYYLDFFSTNALASGTVIHSVPVGFRYPGSVSAYGLLKPYGSTQPSVVFSGGNRIDVYGVTTGMTARLMGNWPTVETSWPTTI